MRESMLCQSRTNKRPGGAGEYSTCSPRSYSLRQHIFYSSEYPMILPSHTATPSQKMNWIIKLTLVVTQNAIARMVNISSSAHPDQFERVPAVANCGPRIVSIRHSSTSTRGARQARVSPQPSTRAHIQLAPRIVRNSLVPSDLGAEFRPLSNQCLREWRTSSRARLDQPPHARVVVTVERDHGQRGAQRLPLFTDTPGFKQANELVYRQVRRARLCGGAWLSSSKHSKWQRRRGGGRRTECPGSTSRSNQGGTESGCSHRARAQPWVFPGHPRVLAPPLESCSANCHTEGHLVCVPSVDEIRADGSLDVLNRRWSWVRFPSRPNMPTIGLTVLGYTESIQSSQDDGKDTCSRRRTRRGGLGKTRNSLSKDGRAMRSCKVA
ncbi:hypothetical protein C8Q80DRAFT_760609 [Daedaleopsis nitida]|nr:hypothetical protein C8Q80DRAFT_760609 [Daedaleopsis nitida]